MMNRLPLRHILCPVDLSSMSMNSLSWANALARARSAELRAFQVMAAIGLTPSARLSPREHDDVMMKLREALSAIDSENPRIGAAVRQGDPGSEIVQFARSLPADVIVMGAAGPDRPDRPIGSVTATVVGRANCPVLIVPTGRQVDQASPGLFRRILCAVDLAPTSVSVIRQALSLAWETHAHLMVVCVMTEPDPPPAEVRENLSAATPPEAHAWCDIELVVKQGVPAGEVVKVAQASNADVLVIGPPRQWTSTTQSVLATSLCPVFVTHDARPLPWPASTRTGETAGAGGAQPVL
jgi:nucleotide-binding universal stress UspA family protein